MNAQMKFDWIVARLTEGRDVYLTTHLKSWRYTPKRLPDIASLLKVSNGHLMMARGKAWDIADGCRITAH